MNGISLSSSMLREGSQLQSKLNSQNIRSNPDFNISDLARFFLNESGYSQAKRGKITID
jgi:hypothetical protein